MARQLRRLWALDEGVRFLNHGSFGATPKELLAEQQRWRDRLEADPPRFFTQELPLLLREAAASLAAFLGTAPERLAFVENATSGVNAVIRSLTFSAGDEILIDGSDLSGGPQHAALCGRALASPARRGRDRAPDPRRRCGHRSRSARSSASAPASWSSTMWLRAPPCDFRCAPSHRCAVNAVCACSSTAHTLPGMVELDIDAISADWYAGNCHKWLCSPKGAGFIVMGKDAKDPIHPAVISNDHDAGFPAEFDYVGTRDPSAWLCVPAAIAFHQRLGGAELRRRNRGLARDVAALLASEIEGELAAAPDLFEAMVAIRLPVGRKTSREEARRFQLRLSRDHRIEAAMTLIGGDLHLRLSAFAYNEIDDYRGLGELVSRLLRE